jgi:hypothetical protein
VLNNVLQYTFIYSLTYQKSFSKRWNFREQEKIDANITNASDVLLFQIPVKVSPWMFRTNSSDPIFTADILQAHVRIPKPG